MSAENDAYAELVLPDISHLTFAGSIAGPYE
jgi:hypothetical protein